MAITRRRLLRNGLGAGVALAAASPRVGQALATQPARPQAPAYAQGFRSLTEEIRLPDVPVDGRLPAWLEGVLLRNGPALFEIGEQKFNHWFDGLAMLHGFGFANGRVSYANRFLRSSAYTAWQRDGVMKYSEFGTDPDPDPCRAMFSGVSTLPLLGRIPNANVSIEQLAKRFQAHTELPVPVRFDADSLRTLGVDATMPNGRMSTAHPHHDPGTGERFSYEIELVSPSGLRVLSERRGVRRELAFIPQERPGYLHSFGLTDRYVVVHTQPWEFDLARFLAPDHGPIATSFVWDGSQPSQILLVDRERGGVAATVELEPSFVFHTINAFDDGDEVVLDVCAHRDSSIVDAMYLKKIRKDGSRVPQATARRLTIQPGSSRVRQRDLAEGNFELPRTDYETVNGRPYRYAYGVGVRYPRRSGFVDQIAKLDVKRGEQTHWQDRGAYPGEPVFVRRPGGRREDDGVLLSVVLDASRRTSYLLVLDARDMSELARAAVPHHIPFGFHGIHSARG
jgi:carotenoid cleavage dioxygenase-like enzyme